MRTAQLNPRSRMLVLNSPHNPTGGVIPRATLQALAELAREHDLIVISDEIYQAMAYDGESPSIAACMRRSASRLTVCCSGSAPASAT